MSKELNLYSKYVPLTDMEMCDKIKALIRIFNDYTKTTHIDSHNINYSKDCLFEIIERVDKRKVYFQVFYPQIRNGISEKNEVALYCFWILKLAPFFNVTNPEIPVNVNFAVHFLLKAVKYYSLKQGVKLKLSDKYICDLKYAFRFRDISKESMMAIVESVSRVAPISPVEVEEGTI